MARAYISSELIEVLASPESGKARVSEYLIEVLAERPTISPTSITGGGVSQHLIEVLAAQSDNRVVVSQHVIEVLSSPIAEDTSGSGGGTRGWVSM